MSLLYTLYALIPLSDEGVWQMGLKYISDSFVLYDYPMIHFMLGFGLLLELLYCICKKLKKNG